MQRAVGARVDVASSCQHCAGVPQPAGRKEVCRPQAGPLGPWLVPFLFPTPCAAPSTSQGGRGGPRAQEPPGARWGFPRALREGEHSESKAKGQSRLGSGNSPCGWVVGSGGAGKGLGPGFLTPPPSRNLRGHGEVQAGISTGWMTHPSPPTHTQVSKPPFSLRGFQRGSPGGGTAPLPKLPRLVRSPLSHMGEGP